MAVFTDIFVEAAREALEFLKADHSFREVDRQVVEENGTQWVFGTITYVESSSQSPSRFVTLSVAPLRLELDLNVGIGEDRTEFYTIHELHQLEGRGEFPGRQHDLYDAMHDREKLLAEFKRLTTVLRSCGSRFFAGDVSLWDDLREQRSGEAQARDDRKASLDAEAAFKAHQWNRIVKLLENREFRLSKLDASRLRYARKQLGRTT
jgi:hypothetical protein